MIVVYIAGPYRGDTAWQVEQNIRKAEQWGYFLAKRYKIIPLIPHTMYRFFNGELTDEFWLEGTLELLRRCDAAWFCEGWRTSEGSVGEYQEAKRLGIPTYPTEPLGEYPDDEDAGWMSTENMSRFVAWLEEQRKSDVTKDLDVIIQEKGS